MKRLLVILLALGAIAGSAPLFSGANFAIQTSNPQSVAAASDFVAPTVTASAIATTASGTPFDGSGFVKQGGTYRVYANVTDAGNPASGVASVSADVTSVSDGGHSAVTLSPGSFTVGGVTYNYASAEQTASSPLSEGSKSYSVTATDDASNSSAPATFHVTADDTAPSIDGSIIARADGTAPGFIRQGDSYFVYANASDSASGIHDVSANVAVSGSVITSGQSSVGLSRSGGPWTVNGTSYAYRSAALTADTPLSDGSRAYAVAATDNAANGFTSPTSGAGSFGVIVDGTAPTVSLTSPTGSSNVRDGITPSAMASDSNGIASVKIQRSPAGANTWTDVCTITTGAGSTYSCSFDTTTIGDGLYDFRAVALDNAGNSANSSAASGVRVDNTAPAVTMANPGSPLTGTVSLSSSSATDTGGSGVASVKYQVAPTGTTNWSDACTGTSGPAFSCSFDTTSVSNSSYDFRAIATDNAGNTGTSATISGRQISNSPHGIGFATTNCTGCTSGKPEPGDTIAFTYNVAMDPASIVPATTNPLMPAWDGTSSRDVQVLIKGSTDSLTEIQLDVSGTLVNLGSVDLGANYVTGSGSLTFSPSPIVMSPDKRTFTITLGSTVGCTGASNCTAKAQQAGPGTGVWTVSTNAKSSTGVSVAPDSIQQTNFTAF